MNMLTQERIKEILEKYKTKSDLFNWCEEYKEFLDDSIHGGVTAEIEYIIKKSYEDSDTPLSYEDLMEAQRNSIKPYDILDRMVFIMENKGLDPNDLKGLTPQEIEDNQELNEIYQEAEQELLDEIQVYEWWLISDPLLYRLDRRGEIILNGKFWGRQTTGQSISLDYCCIKAFIELLEQQIR